MKIISTLGNTQRIELNGFEYLITNKSAYTRRAYTLTFRKAPAAFLDRVNKELKGVIFVSLSEVNLKAETLINTHI